ncbi:MAG: N-6 DNA methylase [Acidobacteriota bacterium]
MSDQAALAAIRRELLSDPAIQDEAMMLAQLGWMFFLKLFDERERDEGDDYQSPLPDALRWCVWARRDDVDDEDLLRFVDRELIPSLADLEFIPGGDRRVPVVRSIFDGAANVVRDGAILRRVIRRIDALDLHDAEARRRFATAWEQAIDGLAIDPREARSLLPRTIADFIVERIDPRLGDKILDPVCGSGRLVTTAIAWLREHDVRTALDDVVLQRSIRAMEKDPLAHCLATVDIMLHGIHVPSQIRRFDLLSGSSKLAASERPSDLLLTQTLFAGERTTSAPPRPDGEAPEDRGSAIVWASLNRLIDGGRGAILVPTSALGRRGMAPRTRRRLLTDCNLHTIVRLPAGVFTADPELRASILFFERNRRGTDVVWFYDQPFPVDDDAFDEIIDWWDERGTTRRGWAVPLSVLRAEHYDLDRANPAGPLDDPVPDDWAITVPPLAEIEVELDTPPAASSTGASSDQAEEVVDDPSAVTMVETSGMPQATETPRLDPGSEPEPWSEGSSPAVDPRAPVHPEPPLDLPTPAHHAFLDLDDEDQLAELWDMLFGLGSQSRDDALNMAAEALRSAGLADFVRLRRDGRLATAIKQAMNSGIRQGYFDWPRPGEIRAVLPDPTAYTPEEWWLCVTESLANGPVPRDEALVEAAQWAERQLGLEADPDAVETIVHKGLGQAIEDALDRHELIAYPDGRIGRAPT